VYNNVKSHFDNPGGGFMHYPVFVAVHGEKESGADPSHTEKGISQVCNMATLLNYIDRYGDVFIEHILLGDARRYWQMAQELVATKQYQRFKDKVYVCDLLGANASVNDFPGQPSQVVYGQTLSVPLSQTIQLDQIFKKRPKMAWEMCRWIAELHGGGGAVWLTGRQFIRALGYTDGKSGMVYRLELNKDWNSTNMHERIIPQIDARGVVQWGMIRTIGD
jgi:hypothetical protein